MFLHVVRQTYSPKSSPHSPFELDDFIFSSSMFKSCAFFSKRKKNKNCEGTKKMMKGSKKEMKHFIKNKDILDFKPEKFKEKTSL